MKDIRLLKSCNVLYVDDEKAAREKLAAILQHYFHAVHLASNGVEALELFKTKSATCCCKLPQFSDT